MIYAKERGKFIQLDILAVSDTLLIREFFARQGDRFELIAPTTAAHANLASIAVVAEGSVSVARPGILGPVLEYAHKGHSTNDVQWDTWQKGKTTYTVLTDVYRYYCITDKQFRKFKSATLRGLDCWVDITPGNILFLAVGSAQVRTGKEGGAQALTAPGIFKGCKGLQLFLGAEAVAVEIEDLGAAV